MQVAEAETPSMTASNNDGDDDFLTLFGAFTVSEKPIPPMSWVEGELAAMDMDNLDQSPQCCRDLQEGYHSDEALLSDMAIDRPPRQGAGLRRSPRNKVGEPAQQSAEGAEVPQKDGKAIDSGIRTTFPRDRAAPGNHTAELAGKAT
ncbi:hypothetical protein KXV52_005903 [Aspergillus fumigatus]|nr:hypothetical protein KXX38_003118 [Aspergillus fumigatus]KAH1774196.1 hypothetical protein KXX62_000661 [Aspergillus fumigatus]KAH1968614.1 hypothetical protein KXV80_001824 [Aspergillus fumigatus]KAH2185888.1 hypothetical protein KXV88_001702 [Aspergillus fumigatus]KAH2205906.1 hypothetical protein KXW59_000879 [Aspergillus fumigatus]